MKKQLHIDFRDEKFYRITRIAYWIGFIGHGFAILQFHWLGVPEMVWFNACFSVPAFLLAIVLNWSGSYNWAFAFAFLELLFHQVATTYYLGWAVGAHYWLIYLAGLSFFNYNWKAVFQYTLLAIVSICFVGLYLLGREGLYTLAPDQEQFLMIFNALTSLVIISLLIHYYSRNTRRAEDELIREQQITERMREKVESLFGQQISQEIAHEMIESEEEIPAKNYDATVMFLDIRDFTVFADSRQPTEVAQFQNIVFGALISIIRNQHGIVLQLLGDGLMAVFGAPKEDESHALRAVQAGYEILKEIQRLHQTGAIPDIRLGIGLHSGSILAGNVGNATRKSYSLTGKNVIIAARIEALNKTFGSQFLVSEAVLVLAGPAVGDHKDLGSVSLKGIEQPVQIYQLM